MRSPADRNPPRQELAGLGAEVMYADLDDVGSLKEAFSGARDPQFARSLNPEMQTFEAWLAVNAGKIPVG